MNAENDIKYLTETIKQSLPKIEGVKWRVEADRILIKGTDIYQFYVGAIFDFSIEDKSFYQKVISKAHEIVSAGQVKLELEKFPQGGTP